MMFCMHLPNTGVRWVLIRSLICRQIMKLIAMHLQNVFFCKWLLVPNYSSVYLYKRSLWEDRLMAQCTALYS